MIKMPGTQPVTFGDKRPEPPKPPQMPKPEKDAPPRRALKPDAKPIPPVETYRQTNGHLYLVRMHYNGVWITGTGDGEAAAVDAMEQFYMRETAQGQKDSVPV